MRLCYIGNLYKIIILSISLPYTPTLPSLSTSPPVSALCSPRSTASVFYLHTHTQLYAPM